MEMKLSATSAASSLALLRFLPSYQNRAWWIAPLTVTRLDQAVRPPICFDFLVSTSVGLIFPFCASHFRGDEWLGGLLAPKKVGVGARAGLPLLSETIWNEGEAIWYSRHASV